MRMDDFALYGIFKKYSFIKTPGTTKLFSTKEIADFIAIHCLLSTLLSIT